MEAYNAMPACMSHIYFLFSVMQDKFDIKDEREGWELYIPYLGLDLSLLSSLFSFLSSSCWGDFFFFRSVFVCSSVSCILKL